MPGYLTHSGITGPAVAAVPPGLALILTLIILAALAPVLLRLTLLKHHGNARSNEPTKETPNREKRDLSKVPTLAPIRRRHPK